MILLILVSLIVFSGSNFDISLDKHFTFEKYCLIFIVCCEIDKTHFQVVIAHHSSQMRSSSELLPHSLPTRL
uniref:Putative ovule protein n=1 Tax=Solanum chacoense TaxID=4108 RepID=A0A0V0I174_SOLCH